MNTQPRRRAPSMPLDPTRALRAAIDLATQVRAEADAGAPDFDAVLGRMEIAAVRFRSACLAQDGVEAEAAVAYHDRVVGELEDEFVPLYYRRAVLDNVLGRYMRSTSNLVSATA